MGREGIMTTRFLDPDRRAVRVANPDAAHVERVDVSGRIEGTRVRDARKVDIRQRRGWAPARVMPRNAVMTLTTLARTTHLCKAAALERDRRKRARRSWGPVIERTRSR
jgi:hypothetical protein